MTEQDPIMSRIVEGQQQAVAGDRAGARAVFAELWERMSTDGDPLHVVSLAHYMADVQDDPADELEWDLRALRAADELTDERAQRYHDSLVVRGFYPSLYLNIAADHAKLGDDTAADEYGEGIRSAITHLRAELSTRAE